MVQEKLYGLGMPYPTDLCSINGSCIGLADYLGYIWQVDGKAYADNKSRVLSKYTIDDLCVWWQRDQFGWVLDNQRAIVPVDVKGQLGIYEIDIQVEER